MNEIETNRQIKKKIYKIEKKPSNLKTKIYNIENKMAKIKSTILNKDAKIEKTLVGLILEFFFQY